MATKFEIPPQNGTEALLALYENIDQRAAPSILTKQPEPAEPAAEPGQMPKDAETKKEDVRFSVWLPKDLHDSLQDKLYERRKNGLPHKQAPIIRDLVSTFIFGHDLMCSKGHRFIIPPQSSGYASDVAERKICVCPFCNEIVTIH